MPEIHILSEEHIQQTVKVDLVLCPYVFVGVGALDSGSYVGCSEGLFIRSIFGACPSG